MLNLFFRTTLFLALILSATACKTTRGYHLNDQNEWTKSPPVDSIAFQTLLQMTNIWDAPELYQAAGFEKYTFSPTLIRVDTNTMLRLDSLGYDKWAVSMRFSGWLGNWVYEQDEEGYWHQIDKEYSSRFVPGIDDKLHQILNDLFTASSRADLAKLTEFLASIEPYMADTIMTTADSVEWHITYTTDLSQDWAWEYEQVLNPTSSLLYSFDSSGKCIHASKINTEMQAYQEKITNPRSTITMTRFKMIFGILAIDCLDAPPIATELTGLKQ